MAKRILFLNWKDILHPGAGGAEVLTDALATFLAINNDVTYITSSFPGAATEEIFHGYRIIRTGTTVSVLLRAYRIFHKLHKENPFALIIDQVHGVPFFSPWYKNHPHIVTLVHEVAGSLWGNVLPSSRIGFFIDTLWLRIYKKQRFIAVSPSTKQELISHGIPSDNIAIVPNFTDIQEAEIPPKPAQPALLVLGRIAPVKRIEHAIRAFTILKKTFPDSTLTILGTYEKKYVSYYSKIRKLAAPEKSITIVKNVSEQEKIAWLKKSTLLILPSQKEGFGIVVLEAAACGTPTVGYSVGGVIDAIKNGTTGILATTETPESIADAMRTLLLDPALYTTIQRNAFQCAQQYTQEHTMKAFNTVLESL